MFKQLGSLQSMLFGWLTMALLFMAVSNAAANEWRVISELPTERAGFSTAVVDGKVYLIDGTLFEHEQGVLREPGPGIWRGPFGMSLKELNHENSFDVRHPDPVCAVNYQCCQSGFRRRKLDAKSRDADTAILF